MAEKGTIQSMMEENRKFEPPKELRETAWIKSFDEYQKMYDRSINDPEGFWGEMAENFHWDKKWNTVRDYDFSDKISITFFDGGQTNVCYNCLDRHVNDGRGDRTAIIWEGNDPKDNKKYTYNELLAEVNQCANTLKDLGVKKGDRVTIYMPMIPELAVSMLACARIGAIHSIVFGGFSADALRDRLLDAESTFLITTDGAHRGAKQIPMKKACDDAMKMCEEAGKPVKTCLVYKHTDTPIDMKAGRDRWWNETVEKASKECEPVWMNAEDPLFILYTSGSTGKPKGVLHTTGGYMVYAATTFKYIFDYHDDDIYWCTADIGWVTGHSYIVYGPLANCATTLMFEGVPTYPDAGRFWDVCQKHGVTIFYTAPTAIRALMREGEEWVKKHDLSKLRVLGSVGEPINPEAWMWYYKNVGNEHAPIMDTWWQTETGGILITPLPGAIATKPGSATFPFFGVKPKVIRENGSQCAPNEGGYLVIEEPWPGMMRTVYNHHERFKETYFSMFKGVYFTGDGARVDDDGYYWLMGRVDDVINVSGHRIGTAEVESALVSHPYVAEAAVVGFPHDVKGQGLYAYVTLKAGQQVNEEVQKELIKHVRKEIGPIATPDRLHFTDALPKTRSGKIMRRILRKIAEGDFKNLGDTSTLADPNVVNALIEGRKA